LTPDPSDRSRKTENALLVQPYPLGRQDPALLEEFIELARSAGANVVGTIAARIDRPSASFYIGSGKVEEVLAACEATGNSANKWGTVIRSFFMASISIIPFTTSWREKKQ
jgi:hypothetical protein